MGQSGGSLNGGVKVPPTDLLTVGVLLEYRYHSKPLSVPSERVLVDCPVEEVHEVPKRVLAPPLVKSRPLTVG
jgi:hypothetical protein